MAAKDLFGQRRPRNPRGERPAALPRQPARRVLLVCEGKKTEPFYFHEMANDLGVARLVEIAKNDGSSPDQVVNRAFELFEEEQRSGDGFDDVYCVFDRDAHEKFHDAVSRLKQLQAEGKPLSWVVSVPCFEFWLLLHFGYTSKPYAAKGKKSVGNAVVSDLKKMAGFDKYDKGMKGVYQTLKLKLDDALRYARRLSAEQAGEAEFANPSTQVHELIEGIRALARR